MKCHGTTQDFLAKGTIDLQNIFCRNAVIKLKTGKKQHGAATSD
jgi:hypothetical protein